MLNPRFLRQTASYNVASTAHQLLKLNGIMSRGEHYPSVPTTVSSSAMSPFPPISRLFNRGICVSTSGM